MEQFVPEENAVVTSDGQTVHYKYLVVCPGIQINWDNVRPPPSAIPQSAGAVR